MARRTSWADLPVELQQNVLLRVPWFDVCRLRAVCMAWNRMTNQPAFKSLHAKTSRPNSCVLTAPRTRLIPPGVNPGVNSCTEIGPWQWLEIATRRLSHTPDTFITRRLQLSGIRHTMAASGGLVYVVYDNSTHVVCNPQQEEFRQIPTPPAHVFRHCHTDVAMVVDAVSQRYRIVVTGPCENSAHPAGPREVSVYDSRVKGWRKLCNVPAAAHTPSPSVVLDGVLYTMCDVVLPAGQRFLELNSCDLDTGAWRFTKFQLSRVSRNACPSLRLSPQLVAASGHLFYVRCSRRKASVTAILVTIWKFALGERKVTKVAKRSKFVKYAPGNPQYPRSLDVPVVACGCGDSIVVSSYLGRRLRWDVLKETWHVLPLFSTVRPRTASHCYFIGPFDIQMRPMPP